MIRPFPDARVRARVEVIDARVGSPPVLWQVFFGLVYLVVNDSVDIDSSTTASNKGYFRFSCFFLALSALQSLLESFN